MIRRLWAGIFTLVAFPAAGDFALNLPVGCTLGQDCFIQNYVDRDQSPEAGDFTCGPLTYDGHKGTDFALPSLLAMHAGVTVYPVANGVVRGQRDGMADRAVTPETMADIKGRECGNGVVVDHGDGWVSQYCHMKQNSIAVRNGQTVTPATPLGQIGLSGRSEFPHLHLSLRHNDQVVDPFSPLAITCGDHGPDTLWADNISYRAGGLIGTGFSAAIPAFDVIKSGNAAIHSLPPEAPAIVLYGHGFGARPGDKILLSITGPSGQLVGSRIDLTKTQAQFFRANGKKRPPGGWPTGRYIGLVRFERGGQLLGQMRQELWVK